MSRFGFWELVCLLGVVHGAFLCVVLWTHRRGRRTANRLLAAVVGLYSLQLLEIVLYWTKVLLEAPHLWGATWFFPYLYGPLLYLYARAMTGASFAWKRGQAAHLLPFVFAVTLFAPFYLQSGTAKAASLEATYVRTGEVSVNAWMLGFWLAQFILFAIYLALSIRQVGKDSSLQHRWLRRLVAAFSLTFACWFFYGLAVGFGFPYQKAIDLAAVLAMTATIYGVGYAALRQPEIFVGELDGAPSKERYAGSTLKQSDANDYATRLKELMESQKPYQDAELRLEGLARLMGVPPHHLSQVINQGFGLNFNDFVNRYRVDEAKRLMTDSKHQSETLLSLAFEAGFNNKTSFNQAFKKFTRMTPSHFRNRLQSGRQ